MGLGRINLDRLRWREDHPTTPLHATNRGWTGFRVFNCNLRRVAEIPLLAKYAGKCFWASNPAWSDADELSAEECRQFAGAASVVELGSLKPFQFVVHISYI